MGGKVRSPGPYMKRPQFDQTESILKHTDAWTAFNFNGRLRHCSPVAHYSGASLRKSELRLEAMPAEEVAISPRGSLRRNPARAEDGDAIRSVRFLAAVAENKTE